jgi:hypothetical protein
MPGWRKASEPEPSEKKEGGVIFDGFLTARAATKLSV